MNTEVMETLAPETLSLTSKTGMWDYSVVNHEILEAGKVLRYSPVGEEVIIYALEGKVHVRTGDSDETVTLEHPYSIKGISPYVIYNAGMTESRVLIIRKNHR